MRMYIYVFLIIGLMTGYLIGNLSVEKKVVYKYVEKGCEIRYDANISGRDAYIKIPAVDENGNGTVTLLHVHIDRGSGKVLTDIDKLLFWVDTQNSIRIARDVAENITGVDLENYDIIYNIETDAGTVEGASAGAAIAIATIAAIEGKEINSSVMITGAINHDGSIGPVGNVVEKARAAKRHGASLLLVPLAHSSDVRFERKKYCEKRGEKTFCWTESVPKKIDIEKEAGIRVIEVSDIKDALKYFFTE